MNNTGLTCIVCGQRAERTAIRADIEAAFCEQHYPKQEIKITVRIHY